MDKKEEKKVVYVQVNEDKDNNHRKIGGAFFLIGGAVLLTGTIMLAVMLLPELTTKNQPSYSGSSSEPYRVSEDTKTIYSNLLSYIGKEAKDIDHNFITPSDITSLSYNNEHYLEMTFVSNNKPGFFKVELNSSNNVEEALNVFKDSVPSVGTYICSVSFEVYGSDVSITIGDINASIKTSKVEGLDPQYVSTVVSKDENTIYCLCHEEYIVDHVYDNYLKATPNDNKVLYDFYYYCLNK